MASKADIWNLALSNMGHKANITDPDEASAEANHCRRFYPIALSMMMERFAWSFATRRAALAEVDNPVDHWAYAYALPNGCVKARAVLLPESTDDTAEQEFAIESDSTGTPILYTNVEDAVLRYTATATDTNRFPPLFVVALSYELAALLVGPIPKDPQIKKAMLDAAVYYSGQAEASDANASRIDAYGGFTPSHLSVRS